MSKIDFSDVSVKLARAGYHIADVEARIAAYLSSDFYRIRLEPQPGGQIGVLFDSLHQPDKVVNAAIGDAIGNLRSALDYIAVAISLPITGVIEKIGFPFADNEAGFKGECGRTSLSWPPDIIKFFVDDVQAYKGGKGHEFWVVNNLRNIDKHRLLLTVANMAGVTASWKTSSGGAENCSMMMQASQTGYFILAPARDFEFTDKPRFSFSVEFDEPKYIARVPVIDFLKKTHSKATSLVKTLDVTL